MFYRGRIGHRGLFVLGPCQHRCGYRARLVASLWRLPVGALALSMTLGGCSYQLEGLAKSKVDPDVTGSVRPRAAARASELPPDGDLALARAAVTEALSSGEKESAVPW